MIWKRRKDGPAHDDQWQQAWDNPQPIAGDKKQQLLQAIQRRIDNGASRRRRVIYISTSAAAAVLVAFVVRVTWMNNKMVPVAEWDAVASNDEKKKVELADGSVIWLAPHSSVRLYPAFTAQRNVVLEKGTAFFAVAQDKTHPFSVAVNRQEVKVLGTSFTVSMKDTVDVNLVVKEGKVALTNQLGQVIVKGGEQVSTYNAVASQVTPVTDMLTDWWLQQEVRFLDVPLGELLDNIEAYYHVTLNTRGIQRNTRVTLTWSFTQTMKENLAVLNLLTGYNIH